MEDVYRLPAITQNSYNRQHYNPRPYKAPSTANSTHMKFDVYKHSKNPYQNNKKQINEQNKVKLNTSESKDIGEENKLTEIDYMKPGTAFPKNGGKTKIHPRICSASVREKRPESRYKKETLCNKLDLEGCLTTHEYYIPILKCGDDAKLEGIMPDCWQTTKQ